MSTLAVHHFSVLVPVLWGPVGISSWVAVAWFMARKRDES